MTNLFPLPYWAPALKRVPIRFKFSRRFDGRCAGGRAKERVLLRRWSWLGKYS